MKQPDKSQDDFEVVLESARSLLLGREIGVQTGIGADPSAANERVDHALALRLKSAAAWILKSQILSTLGDDVAAFAAIEMAISHEIRNAEAHYWRGAILSDLGQHDEALSALERSFRYIGTSDNSWLLEDLYCEKAMVLDALGRHDDAVSTYEAGLKRCPRSSLLNAGLAPLRRATFKSKCKVLVGGLG